MGMHLLESGVPSVLQLVLIVCARLALVDDGDDSAGAIGCGGRTVV